MADNLSSEDRRRNMQSIKSNGTGPEETVRKFLFAKGFRYRKNDKRFPGCPDIVLAKYRAMVFVNGCFWHMHENCSYFKMPKSNILYWQTKLEKNRARDAANYEKLRAAGWNVIVIWECELRKYNRDETLNKLAVYLYSLL